MGGAFSLARGSLVRERLRNDLRRFETFLRALVRNRLALVGLVIVLSFLAFALLAPLVVGPYPTTFDKDNPLLAPSNRHPLGTDKQGFDILVILVYGSQISLLVGFTSAAVAMLLGTAVGLSGGYYGHQVDQVLARATDFFLVIPWLPFVIVLSVILGPSLLTTIIAIAIVSWPTTARIVRSQVLSLRERLFVERARAIGAGDGHVLWKHILPNVLPLIFAQAVLTISTAIFTEAFLSFFGLGPVGSISWGTMIEDSWISLALLRGMWWYFGPPGVFITLVVLGFSLLSYGLEEVLN
ncbi:MAG: ABC transporter permease, partial [Thermoplasmata archaeon]